MARTDPAGLLQSMDKVTIDEVQRAPGLLLAIKQSVDQDRRPGRFLLTGSAHVFTLPNITDSLAGRLEVLYLYPLTRSEIMGQRSTFIPKLLQGRPSVETCSRPMVGDDLIKMVLAGGYPEALHRTDTFRRQAWFDSYLDSMTAQDLRDMIIVRNMPQVRKILNVMEEYASQLVNYSKLGNSLDVSYKTIQHHMDLLEQIFLITRLTPWHTNRIKRLVKTPKLYFLDSGLLATLRQLTFERLKEQRRRSLWGPLLENYVISEITKFLSMTPHQGLIPYFLRQNQRFEVDMILERSDGMLIGIEIKAKAEVRAQDFVGLKTLQKLHEDRFAYGIVLYDGTESFSFGKKLSAEPISRLWQ